MHWDGEQMPVIQGKTHIVAIIGNPISHSLSPVMHNAAFRNCLLDYVYVPFAVTGVNLELAVKGLKALGVCGFNVTIPHKTAIIPFLDRLDESAESAGAVNTVQLCDSELIGYNTDGDGLVDSLYADLNYIPGTEQILVIGAGGAARGAIAALCRSGAKKILICNRSIDNARAIMADMNVRYPDTAIGVVSNRGLSSDHLHISALVLNTTSLGMAGERIEFVNLSQLPEYAKVYDMVYSRAGTLLVKEASARGLQAANGLGMLIAQGERAFAIWTGIKAPEGVMHKALDCI